MKFPIALTISYGAEYQYSVVLDQLYTLPVKNWKKLCRIMASDIFQNDVTWGKFATWFPLAIENAKADRAHAQFLCRSLYADPNNAPKGEKTRTKQRNAYYAKILSDADHRVRKLEKFYSIFKGDMTT